MNATRSRRRIVIEATPLIAEDRVAGHQTIARPAIARAVTAYSTSSKLFQTEPSLLGSLPTVRGGSDNRMEPVAIAPSR
jgi:hypothetical protein